MTITIVALTDTFDGWRVKTNQTITQSNVYEVNIPDLYNKSNNSPSYAYANNIGVQANTFANNIGVQANNFTKATIAGANTAVGDGANNFTKATLNGANTAARDATNLTSGTVPSARITGVGTISTGVWNGTAIAVGYGGTGGNDQATARSGLGLVIGTNVQAYSARLGEIAALAPTADNFIVGNGTAWTLETPSSARTSLGLGTIATQSSSSVSITGGSITGITDITLADGGTGATLTACSGAVAYSTASAIALSDIGTSGQVLASGGTGAPTWSNGLPVTQIPNAANLNTYTTPGQYHQSSDAAATAGTNYPVALAGLLEVHASSVMVYQRYTTYNSGRIYTRSSYNGTWYAWLTNLDSMSYNAFAPTLTGTGATGTWSINITGDAGYATAAGSATTAGTASNSNKLVNLDAAYSAAATSIVARDSAADITARLFRSEYADQTGIVGSIAFRTNNTNDNYIRYCNSASAVRTWLGLGTIATQASSSVSISGGSISGLSSLAVSGDITATGDITAFSSDARLKGDIQTITNALSKVKSITGITYKHNDLAKSFGYTDENRFAGVLAQEVEAVLPEVVVPAPFDVADDGTSKSGENYKTVKYEKIVSLLIEAIKELSSQVESMKLEIEELKK